MAINKDNQILLSKLVEISSGKWSSVPKAMLSPQALSNTQSGKFLQPSQISLTRNKSNASTFIQGGAMGAVRSLNLGVRKQETDRIEKENHAFAKRLFEKAPHVDHTRHDEDY